jgi:hypothetical protein
LNFQLISLPLVFATLRFAVQVRLDVEEVCRGWETLGLVTNDLAGIIKLRACVSNDSP